MRQGQTCFRKENNMTALRVAALVGLAMSLASTPALAAPSDSAEPAPDPEIAPYNNGVQLMLKKKFEKAEKWFRKALKSEEGFAEAHNNIGYVLRKQGPERYEEALRHYDRAIEIKPGLAQPYMYRGVLHVQMGHVALAEKDYETLRELSSELARELAHVIENKEEKEPEQFFGVSREIE